MVPKDRLAEGEVKMAACVLDIGLTLQVLVFNTGAIPGSAINGHKIASKT